MNEDNNQNNQTQAIGVTAVAKELGVSKATVVRWVRAEKIDGFFRIGRKWLIRKVDFENFINKKIGNNTSL